MFFFRILFGFHPAAVRVAGWLDQAEERKNVMEEPKKQKGMKELEAEFDKFVRKYGLDYLQVLNDLLDYIIYYCDPEPKPHPHWRYNREQNEGFHGLMCLYFEILPRLTNTNMGWYDCWGDLFMSFRGKFGASVMGQFFTPVHISQLLSDLTTTDEMLDKEATFPTTFGNRVIVNDPTCGSSRMLLAAQATYIRLEKRAPYLIGEDLDPLCCKMSAVNMMAHGCFGEVVHHDTLLEPGHVRTGYIINEGLYPFVPGIPTIRVTNDERCFVCCRVWESIRQEHERQSQEAPVLEVKNPARVEVTKEPEPPVVVLQKRPEPVQLEMFPI